jgi:hypothetical protein
MKKPLAIALALVFFATSLALADEIDARTMGIWWQRGVPHLYYSARDLITSEGTRKLDSGLPQRIAVQHFVYAHPGTEPLVVAGHGCKVVYDLWQGVYRVEYEQLGVASQMLAFRSRAEVLERCLVMRGAPLGEASDYLPGQRLYVAALIQLNPLSNTTVARIRRWLSRPRGEFNGDGKAFFGSFVSLFVNDRIGSAERVIRLKSQDFEQP